MKDKKEITIIYSMEESVTYCFWKYFFEACGIWTRAFEAKKFLKTFVEDEKYLFILSKSDDFLVDNNSKKNVFYIKKHINKNEKQRKDIVKISWRDNKGFQEPLEVLFGKRCILVELLPLFLNTSMWSSAWMYSELGKCPKWKGEIQNTCDQVLAQLPVLERKAGRDNYYIVFMKLYCNWLRIGSRNDSLIYTLGNEEESQKIVDLLGECIDFGHYNKWNLPTCMLAARVSKINAITRKHTLEFYQKAREQEESAEILYNIGYQYEHVEGDFDLALEYYKKSYQKNEDYPRAVFKIACDFEKNRRIRDWISLCQKIIQKMPSLDDDQYNPISVKEIEYYYKFLRMLKVAFEQFTGADDYVEHYNKNIISLADRVKSGVVFSKLIHCMFVATSGEKDESMSRCISDEIISKISV